MEPAEVLARAREGLAVMAERYARLVEELDDLSAAIPGSQWTVRDAAVHLTGHGDRYTALVSGGATLSAIPVDKEVFDARARGLIDENPETDPKGLAEQISEGYSRFLAAVATLPPESRVDYFAGLRPNVATIASLVLGEPMLHGFDIAAAVGKPWPIDPDQACLPVAAYRSLYSAVFQPRAADGIEATFCVDVPGTGPFFVRIADSTYRELPSAESVDCVISADPVTALLVISGRLSRWAAIALGRLTFNGDRSELGPRFFDLFLFP